MAKKQVDSCHGDGLNAFAGRQDFELRANLGSVIPCSITTWQGVMSMGNSGRSEVIERVSPSVTQSSVND